MGTTRIPGPVCSTQLTCDLDGGTLVRNWSPAPGPYCSALDLAALKRQADKVRTLFNMCLAPLKGLTLKEYEAAGVALTVEPEVIRAIVASETETAGSYEGRPIILYERHYFHRLTDGKYDKDHPAISDAKRGEYGKFRAQYGKLEMAFLLDETAALKSASWGIFQIMGANYAAAGFTSVHEMVAAMSESEAAQLAAFVSFVKTNPKLLKALQTKDWKAIARAYNGPKYAENKYDTKLKGFYDSFKPKPAPAAPAPAPVPGKVPAKSSAAASVKFGLGKP